MKQFTFYEKLVIFCRLRWLGFKRQIVNTYRLDLQEVISYSTPNILNRHDHPNQLSAQIY